MTPFLLQCIARELEAYFKSSRLNQISQPSSDVLYLSGYHPHRKLKYIVISTALSHPIIFFSNQKPPSQLSPPNFCRSLRKHLEYAQLINIEIQPGEKILKLYFKTSSGTFQLIFECLPKYPNLILVDFNHRIVSALRYKNNPERPVLPQHPYHPPPRSISKPNFWNLSIQELNQHWNHAQSQDFTQWIQNEFQGTDAQLASWIYQNNTMDFEKWEHTKQKVLTQPWDYFEIQTSASSLILSPFPLSGPTPTTRLYDQAHLALDSFYTLQLNQMTFLKEKANLESKIRKTLKHEKKILERVQQDRAHALLSDQYQFWGDLLLASLTHISPHSSSINLPDIIHGASQTVTIPLNPSLSPIQNVQFYFQKSKKGVRGLSLIEKRVLDVKNRIEFLQSSLRSIPAIHHLHEIEKINQELFPKPIRPITPPKITVKSIPPPHVFKERLDSKLELCAGTSASGNEYITFQLAQPEDLWFHVRDFPGPHVILRKLEKNISVSDEAILKAAQWAADHSQASKQSLVTISYTLKKYVKKIPGGKPGMVSFSKEKSIFIKPHIPSSD